MAGSIIAGQKGRATDFINESEKNATPANDAGRVAKLETDAKISNQFLRTVFGGDGSDGALTVSSGTTNIDMGGAQVFVKQYSSISITGTAKVVFINPHANGTVIVVKCKGACTLTSSQAPMLDASGCGAAGGTGGTRSSAGGNTEGADGGDGTNFAGLATDGGHNTGTGTGHEGGVAGVYTYIKTIDTSYYQLFEQYSKLFVGGGGGGGRGTWTSAGSGSVIGGNGGSGGGALIIEVNGALNFTTTNGISAAGKAGVDGSITGSPTNYSAGGGGGGAGGCVFLFYNIATAVTGTINIAGGAGGIGLGGGSSTGRSGNGGGGIDAGSGGSDENNSPDGGSGATGDYAFAKNAYYF